MSPQTPIGEQTFKIDGLGNMKGHLYANGVRQFCGIPYARLAKRWTRSKLATSWENDYHDGTKLGPSAPNPPEYAGMSPLTPVPDIPHFNIPQEDELNCLVMNITIPPASISGILPVMVYIHGGSFLFGGANLPVFDCVNLVSYAIERGTPIIAINFNYRVGLGGFLASLAIRADLEKDGLEGVGNFGLTDQQVALEWVQKYVGYLGGDKNNVTIFGESAGGMSVSHQVAAKSPAIFHRAIAMSGILNTIPTWSMEQHERHYNALLRYLKINIDSPDTLEQLRAIPQSVIAAATLPVEGVYVATGNPCNDGVFHSKRPTWDNIESPPSWLKSYMVGDVLDEAIIFRTQIDKDDYTSLRKQMLQYIPSEETDKILSLYGITPSTSQTDVANRIEDMAGDAIFKTQNYQHLQMSKISRTYSYHIDQRSTLDNILKGTAYHAIELLYIFMNLKNEMTPGQLELSYKMAGDWIDFACGKDPWERYTVGRKCMIYGPDDKWVVKDEFDDEPVRRYGRMREIIAMGVYDSFVLAMDDVVTKRFLMGTNS